MSPIRKYSFSEEVRRPFGSGMMPEESPKKKLLSFLIVKDLDEDMAEVSAEILTRDKKVINLSEIEVENAYSFNYNTEQFFAMTDNDMSEEVYEDITDRINSDGITEYFSNDILKQHIHDGHFIRMQENYYEELMNEWEEEDSEGEYENRLIEEAVSRSINFEENAFTRKEDGTLDYSRFTGNIQRIKDALVANYVRNEEALVWYEDAYGEEALINEAVESESIDTDSLITLEAEYYTDSPSNFAELRGATYWGEHNNVYLFSRDY